MAQRKRLAGWRAGVPLLCTTVCVAACGSTQGHRSIGKRFGKNVVRVTSVRVPEGKMVFFGEDFEHDGKQYLMIATAEERPGKAGFNAGKAGKNLGGGSSGAFVTAGETRQLAMAIQSGCRGNTPAPTIGYGVMRNPADTISARNVDGPVKVARVKIPKKLHMPGDVVYVLAPRPTEVIVRAPNGHVVARERIVGMTCSDSNRKAEA